MYSFFAVMIAIALGMKSAVFSFVMQRMWLAGIYGKSNGERTVLVNNTT